MPPLGGAAENYNIGAQLRSLLYANTSKFWLKWYAIYLFRCVQTCQFWPISSTTITDLKRGCVRTQRAIRNFFTYLHIHSTIAIRCSWNFIYRLLINGWSCVHKHCGKILKTLKFFCRFQWKLWRNLTIYFKMTQKVSNYVSSSKERPKPRENQSINGEAVLRGSAEHRGRSARPKSAILSVTNKKRNAKTLLFSFSCRQV